MINVNANHSPNVFPAVRCSAIPTREITNAHLADGSSSSYLSIVRLSFSVFALRNRRKKLALRTRFFSHSRRDPSLNQSVTFSDRCSRLRDGIAAWWNSSRNFAVERPGRPSVPTRPRFTPFFLDIQIYRYSAYRDVFDDRSNLPAGSRSRKDLRSRDQRG